MTGKIKFESSTPAVITADKEITYSELGYSISGFSQSFRAKGVAEGEYTGVLLNNSADFIASVFALWKLNAVPVLLNSKLTAKEIDELLTRHNIKKVITNNKYADKTSSGLNLINIDAVDIERKEEVTAAIPINKLVIFTSGSSGSPKGVVINARGLLSSILSGNSVIHQRENDRWLASLPFYHIGGLMIFLRALTFGASVILPGTLKLEEIKRSIENKKPTLASLVPTQLQRLIEEGVRPNPELRILLLGGGAIGLLLVKEALDIRWPVWAVYGATETASFVAYASSDELRKNPGTAGRAVYPNQIEIIDSGVIEGDPSGEIVINSPSLFEKYLNDPEETGHRLVNGKYYTGDYGILDKDDYLYVLSRRTDMIVTGGENVDPVEVEKAIMQFPGIKDVCVFGRKNTEWGEVVNAAVLADESFSEDALTDFLKKDLARYKIPKQYFRVNDIPRTALGKIRREKIKAMFNQQ